MKHLPPSLNQALRAPLITGPSLAAVAGGASPVPRGPRPIDRRMLAHEVIDELRREVLQTLGPAGRPVEFLLAGVHRSLANVLPVYAATQVSAALRRFSVRPATSAISAHALINKLEDVLLRLDGILKGAAPDNRKNIYVVDSQPASVPQSMP